MNKVYFKGCLGNWNTWLDKENEDKERSESEVQICDMTQTLISHIWVRNATWLSMTPTSTPLLSSFQHMNTLLYALALGTGIRCEMWALEKWDCPPKKNNTRGHYTSHPKTTYSLRVRCHLAATVIMIQRNVQFRNYTCPITLTS